MTRTCRPRSPVLASSPMTSMPIKNVTIETTITVCAAAVNTTIASKTYIATVAVRHLRTSPYAATHNRNPNARKNHASGSGLTLCNVRPFAIVPFMRHGQRPFDGAYRSGLVGVVMFIGVG